MSFISAFDVMGPNMIGPSSSHTAGAARIAFLARKMFKQYTEKKFSLHSMDLLQKLIMDTERIVPYQVESWDLEPMI